MAKVEIEFRGGSGVPEAAPNTDNVYKSNIQTIELNMLGAALAIVNGKQRNASIEVIVLVMTGSSTLLLREKH